MQYIAVLMTCHNRVNRTLKCLKALFEANLPEDLKINVFLVDDGSSDNTGTIVKNTYPEVNIVQGTGNLYWNAGMRLAWETAAHHRDYDFYILLNDDTILFKYAFTSLFDDYESIKLKTNAPLAIMGACCDEEAGHVSYSGKNDINEKTQIIPSGTPQKCSYMCGNFVLIPKDTYIHIGGLSEKIIHRFGDYEYSARLVKMGGTCWITSRYCAHCINEEFKCFNPNVSFIKRIKALHSPIGLSLNDDITFKRLYNNKGWAVWIFTIIKKYFLCFFPKSYKWGKKNIGNRFRLFF